jgi:hypothetical protein
MTKKIILIAVASVTGLVALLAIVIAMQPSEFHISRTAKMDATPEEVFAQVNDFHSWEKWSPWLKLDPNAKGTYEGPTSGEGAIFRWAGNAEVGEGSMEIVESKSPEHIRIKLHFLKPFEDTALTEFHIKPAGDQTAITWSMSGRNNFISKAVCLLLMDMEEMIGGNYEEGLANMKKIVEAPEEPPMLATEPADTKTTDTATQ